MTNRIALITLMLLSSIGASPVGAAIYQVDYEGSAVLPEPVSHWTSFGVGSYFHYPDSGSYGYIGADSYRGKHSFYEGMGFPDEEHFLSIRPYLTDGNDFSDIAVETELFDEISGEYYRSTTLVPEYEFLLYKEDQDTVSGLDLESVNRIDATIKSIDFQSNGDGTSDLSYILSLEFDGELRSEFQPVETGKAKDWAETVPTLVDYARNAITIANLVNDWQLETILLVAEEVFGAEIGNVVTDGLFTAGQSILGAALIVPTDPITVVMGALALANQALFLVELEMIDRIQNDPPDSNYKELAEVDVPSITIDELDFLPSDARDIILANLHLKAEFIATLRALLTSMERVAGAMEASDDYWASLQDEAVAQFFARLRELVSLIVGSNTATAGVVSEWDYIDFSLTVPEVEEIQRQILANGLPQRELDIISLFDWDAQDIQSQVDAFLTIDASVIAGISNLSASELFHGADRYEYYTAQFSTVPEPSAIAIWSILGIAGLGYGWRRKRRAA